MWTLVRLVALKCLIAKYRSRFYMRSRVWTGLDYTSNAYQSKRLLLTSHKLECKLFRCWIGQRSDSRNQRENWVDIRRFVRNWAELSLKSGNLGRCALCLAIYHMGLFTIGRPSCIVRDLMSSDGNSNIKVNDPLIGLRVYLAIILSYFKSHSSIVFVVHCDWLNRRWAFAFKLEHIGQ